MTTFPANPTSNKFSTASMPISRPATNYRHHRLPSPPPPNACGASATHIRLSSPARAEIDRLSSIDTDFDAQRASANAMGTEPWVSAKRVARHLGVAKDTG
jgi:hypothetical protein